MPPVKESTENQTDSFLNLTDVYLRKNNGDVEHINDSYKKHYSKDIYWSYFDTDYGAIAKDKMERTDQLDHRFDACKVRVRKKI